MNPLPLLSGAAGMVFVGGSVAVSGALAGAPVLTVQALRYAVACLLLVLFARLSGLRPVPGSRAVSGSPVVFGSSGFLGRMVGSAGRLVRPRGAEWLWLAGVVVTGMFVFNLALVLGARHAEPAVLGVAVACVPVLLAVAGPFLEGRAPAARLVAAAAVVTAGAALVQGFGRTDGIGLLWALVTFACEAGFTLLAVPVLGRHGPLGVSVHATWMAAVLFAMTGVVREGPGAVLRLGTTDLLAGLYLAVCVTALAFVLWYTCVSRVGSARAGLLTGIAPIAAAVVGVLMGGPMPSPVVWAGVAVVAAGLGLGLRRTTAVPVAPDAPPAVAVASVALPGVADAPSAVPVAPVALPGVPDAPSAVPVAPVALPGAPDASVAWVASPVVRATPPFNAVSSAALVESVAKLS
ncbi:EamA family transporter [Actinoplanes sp. CA-030573]|uniref:EamA family transporter n=1 Tax=Actinoplanes sp. CA-030573 TaxID=3239898 RepID=UPI003D89CF30